MGGATRCVMHTVVTTYALHAIFLPAVVARFSTAYAAETIPPCEAGSAWTREHPEGRFSANLYQKGLRKDGRAWPPGPGSICPAQCPANRLSDRIVELHMVST